MGWNARRLGGRLDLPGTSTSVGVPRFLVLVVGLKTRSGVDVGGHFLHLPLLVVLLVEGGLPMAGLERVEAVFTAAELGIGRLLVEGDRIDPGLLPQGGVRPDLLGLAVPHAAVGGEGFAVPEEFGEVSHDEDLLSLRGGGVDIEI